MNEISDLSEGRIFDYLTFPFQKSQESEEHPTIFSSIANKTYFFLNGEIIGTYRKRVMGSADFSPYNKLEEVKYFHSGIVGKEQEQHELLFKIFGLEICADHSQKILLQDSEKVQNKLPFFHIIQSNTISFYGTILRDGIVIKVDIFEDRSVVGTVKNKKFQSIPKNSETTQGNFRFSSWINMRMI